jgi:D-lactate dehydrogenase
VDTAALIERLKAGTQGAVDLNVYELKKGVFFENPADTPLPDNMLARLIGFPNVLITSRTKAFSRAKS